MRYFFILLILASMLSCSKERIEFCEGSEQCNLQVYPLPFDQDFKISLHSNVKDSISFKYYNLFGTLILENQDLLLIGKNVFSVSSDDFSEGVYIMKAITSSDTFNIRLVKKTTD